MITFSVLKLEAQHFSPKKNLFIFSFMSKYLMLKSTVSPLDIKTFLSSGAIITRQDYQDIKGVMMQKCCLFTTYTQKQHKCTLHCSTGLPCRVTSYLKVSNVLQTCLPFLFPEKHRTKITASAKSCEPTFLLCLYPKVFF